MTYNSPRPLSRFSASLFLFAASVLAQTPGTGAIQGTVYDPSGRAVPKAHVAIENEATHLSRIAATNANGAFAVPLLAPGSYSLVVKVEGSKRRTRMRCRWL